MSSFLCSKQSPVQRVDVSMCNQKYLRGREYHLLDSMPCISYNRPTVSILELVDLIRAVPQLLEHARQLALLRGARLVPADGLV